jgi:paraquat-inducible protein B
MTTDLLETSRALRDLVASPDVLAVPGELARTLEGIDGLVRMLHAEIEPLSPLVADATTSVREVADELKSTLQAIHPAVEALRETAKRTQEAEDEMILTLEAARALMDPNAPLVVQLQATLREFGAAARSLRSLAEMVERDPGSLLRGRDTGNP